MIILADLWLSLCVLTVILIAADCRSHPQRMGVMNMTWPLTGLYFGPIAGWLYRTLGRSQRTGDHAGAHHHQHMLGSSGSHDVSIRATLVSTTHCGGGCVLGDLIGETLAGAFSLTLFGSKLAAGWILDFVLAFLLGIAFQYCSVRRRKIWDFGWCEITEVLAHLVMLFRRHAADEASAVSGWCRV